MATEQVTFRQLSNGDTFDFVAPTGYNSFYERCTKLSARKYSYSSSHPVPFGRYVTSVGSINVQVYNVIHKGADNA